METVVDSTVFFIPILENLKSVTGQRLLDWHGIATGFIFGGLASQAAQESIVETLSMLFAFTLQGNRTACVSM